MADYSKMTSEDFDDILAELAQTEGRQIILIPGVYEILAEHFNNTVLDVWAERHPELADHYQKDTEMITRIVQNEYVDHDDTCISELDADGNWLEAL